MRDKRARIRAKADKQLTNDAAWWLWEVETKHVEYKARIIARVEDLALRIRCYYSVPRKK